MRPVFSTYTQIKYRSEAPCALIYWVQFPLESRFEVFNWKAVAGLRVLSEDMPGSFRIDGDT